MDINLINVPYDSLPRTAIAELLYSDCDKRLNSASWQIGDITPEDWANHCCILAFLLCNYRIHESLSRGELSTLMAMTAGTRSTLVTTWNGDPSDYPPLQDFLYPGFIESDLFAYFNGNRVFAMTSTRESWRYETILYLEYAQENIEEQLGANEMGVYGPPDLTTACDLTTFAIRKIMDWSKENNVGE